MKLKISSRQSRLTPEVKRVLWKHWKDYCRVEYDPESIGEYFRLNRPIDFDETGIDYIQVPREHVFAALLSKNLHGTDTFEDPALEKIKALPEEIQLQLLELVFQEKFYEVEIPVSGYCRAIE